VVTGPLGDRARLGAARRRGARSRFASDQPGRSPDRWSV